MGHPDGHRPPFVGWPLESTGSMSKLRPYLMLQQEVSSASAVRIYLEFGGTPEASPYMQPDPVLVRPVAVGSRLLASRIAALVRRTNQVRISLGLDSERYSHGLVTNPPYRRPDPYRASPPTIKIEIVNENYK